MDECKFNKATAEFIQKQGMDDCDSFKNWTTKELDDAIKAISSITFPRVMDKSDKTKEAGADEQIILPLIGQRTFKILFCWCNCQNLSGVEPDVSKFKGKQVTLYNAHQRELVIYKSIPKELAPKLPDKFKSWAKWKQFEDSVIIFLKLIRSDGPEGVFLICLIREHDNPTAEMLANSQGLRHRR